MPLKDPVAKAAYQKAYRAKHLERLLAYDRANSKGRSAAYTAAHPGHWRKAMYKRRYGITQEQYEEMVIAQGGLCYICHRPPTGRAAAGQKPLLHVDHNHITNRVRKLLCSRCNQAIGLFDEVQDRILAAAAYLQEFDDEYTSY